MKVLLIDIETAPNTAFVWGLFDQNISHDQVVESSYVLCWSAKWLGKPRTYFESTEKQERAAVLRPIHALLNEADVVIHFNGLKFDIPVLNREFIKHGLTPPAPYKQLDLYRVVKSAFRFESNKLAYITQALGLDSKIKHEGQRYHCQACGGWFRSNKVLVRDKAERGVNIAV